MLRLDCNDSSPAAKQIERQNTPILNRKHPTAGALIQGSDAGKGRQLRMIGPSHNQSNKLHLSSKPRNKLHRLKGNESFVNIFNRRNSASYQNMYGTHIQTQGPSALQLRYQFSPDACRRPVYEQTMHKTDALSSIKISDTRSLAQREVPNQETSTSDVHDPRIYVRHEQPLDLSVKRPRLANKNSQLLHYVNEQELLHHFNSRDQLPGRHSISRPNSRDNRKEIIPKDSETIEAQRAWAAMVKHRQRDQQSECARRLERDMIRNAIIGKVNQQRTFDAQANRELGETASNASSSGVISLNKTMYKGDVSKYDINKTHRLEQQRPHGVKRSYQANEPRENAKINEFSPRVAYVVPRKKDSLHNERSSQEMCDDSRIKSMVQADMVRGRTFFPPVMSVAEMANLLPDSYHATSAQTQNALLQSMYARVRYATDPSAIGLIHNSMIAGRKINKLLKSLDNEKSKRSESAKFCVASRGGLKGIRRQQMEELRRTRMRDSDSLNDQLELNSLGKITPRASQAEANHAALTSISNPTSFSQLTQQRSHKERRRAQTLNPGVLPEVQQRSGNVITSTKRSEESRTGENRYQVVINKKHQPIKLSVTPPVSYQTPTKTVSAKNLNISTGKLPQSIQPAPASIIPKRMAEKRMRHGVHNRHRDDTKRVFPTSSPEYAHSPKSGTLPGVLHDYHFQSMHFRSSRTSDIDPLGDMIRAEIARKSVPKSESSFSRGLFPTTEKDLNRSTRDKYDNMRNFGRMNMTLSELARRDMLKKQFKLSCVDTKGTKSTVQEERCAEKIKMNNRRMQEELLRGKDREVLHNPSKFPTINSSPLTSPIADQPSPPMPVLTPQRVVHPDEEPVRSGDSPIPVLKDARHEGPDPSMPLSPSRHEFRSIHSSLDEELLRNNFQRRFEMLKPCAASLPTRNTTPDYRVSLNNTPPDNVYTTGKVNYGESVSQATKAALQQIFREANDQVVNFQKYKQKMRLNFNEQDHNIFSRLGNLREDISPSGNPGSKRNAMEVIDLTDSREASPSPVYSNQSTNRNISSILPGKLQHPPVEEPREIISAKATPECSESNGNDSKEQCQTDSHQEENGSQRLPHDSPFRKVYRGMKQRVMASNYQKLPSPLAQEKFTARFSDPNVLRLSKEVPVSKQSVVVAKTVWPTSPEPERLSFTNVNEVRDTDDAVDYFGRSGPEQLEDVKIPAIRFPQSEDMVDQIDPVKHSRSPSVSPRRDGIQMLDADINLMEQRLKNISPTVTTLTGETIIKPPRKRPLEVCRLANSEGYVAEVKGEKHEDLLTDSGHLDREERALKRAILQFNQMEAKEKELTRRHENDIECNEDDVGPYKEDDQQQLIGSTDDNYDNVFPANDEEIVNGHHHDKEFAPLVLRRRTRNAGARLGSAQKPYNKNARYELEIEKERVKYWERRRQRSTSMSVSEDVEEEAPPAKRRPGRPPKKENERKASTNSNSTAQILSEKIKMKYKGCGRGKYPRVRRISVDSRKSIDKDVQSNIHTKTISDEYEADTITEDAPMAIGERRKSSTSSAGRRSMRCVVDPSNHNKIKFVAISPDGVKAEKPPARTPGRKRKIKTKHLGDMLEWPDQDGGDVAEHRDFDEENVVIKSEEETLEFQRPEPPPDFRKILANKKLGETILHRAARLGYDDVAIYCVDYCILDINAKDNAGYTALHECCVHGRLKIAHKLLSHGADVNAGAVDGTRPIHDAVDNDHLEVVRLLLSFGADPLLATYSGRTTLKLARSKDVRSLLLGFLVDVNGTWEMGEDEEPLTAKDLKWQFSGTFFDDTRDSGYNIFEDIPGPDSDGEDNFELEMELSDSPHLQTFNMQVDETKGPRNWCLFSDVSKTVGMSRDKFEVMHPTIPIVRVCGEELKKSLCESQVASCVDDVDVNNKFELVELNDDVRQLLGVEILCIK
ncbi:uncharacterized protein LOC117121504 isoform X2 [Anneissia japonica]|uniref:uncharacterized protein LOC117121504 isoform X2 n=1 Tax=Anneissia japonica TaxID=1529436 RepID=UPI0014255C9F|nr:uncharacterized protein LOC117121504 isoform X2 [Anneissia japonica]